MIAGSGSVIVDVIQLWLFSCREAHDAEDELRNRIGSIQFPVLWVDRNYNWISKEPYFDMVPTIRFADTVVFVFAGNDDASSQLLMQLEWSQMNVRPDCNLYILRLAGDAPVKLNRNWNPQKLGATELDLLCLLYTSPSPRDKRQSRMPSSA